MKLADTNSRLGRKLGKLLPADKEENKTDEKRTPPKGDKKRRIFNPTEEPETKLEKRIKQWFTAEEQGDRPFIIREIGKRHYKILVLTYYRAILFKAGCFRKLEDKSDKVWRQFVSVRLIEGNFCSTLELSFFRYHDTLFYHNPYKDTSPYMEETEFKLDPWRLEQLNKEEGSSIYRVLKDKQIYWQERRREEHMAQIGSLNSKPPGGQPPKKD
jgi:hypothetical protein